jgi:hypothetical protein
MLQRYMIYGNKKKKYYSCQLFFAYFHLFFGLTHFLDFFSRFAFFIKEIQQWQCAVLFEYLRGMCGLGSVVKIHPIQTCTCEQMPHRMTLHEWVGLKPEEHPVNIENSASETDDECNEWEGHPLQVHCLHLRHLYHRPRPRHQHQQVIINYQWSYPLH